MDSKERILATLTGGQPDRVPISTYELCGFNSQAFENREPSYANLMQFIREKVDCICMWSPSCDGRFLESSYPVEMDETREEADGATTTHRTIHTPKGDLTQTWKVFENVHTVWVTEHWCKSIEDVDKALSVPYEPVTFDASDYTRIAGEVGGRGILMDSILDPLAMTGDLMEFGDYTVWALTETEHFARTVAVLHERLMESLRRRLDANVCELYRLCGPEYATPPYLPPELFARLVVPYVREMVDLIHEKGALVRFHCHGKIGQVLDLIAETGADAMDPCEAPPDGDIELADVKRRVGDRICLCGNLQLKLLEHGSREQVVAAVKKCMDSAKAGGRYMILPTAAPINIPLAKKTEENYFAWIDAALEFGEY